MIHILLVTLAVGAIALKIVEARIDPTRRWGLVVPKPARSLRDESAVHSPRRGDEDHQEQEEPSPARWDSRHERNQRFARDEGPRRPRLPKKVNSLPKTFCLQ